MKKIVLLLVAVTLVMSLGACHNRAKETPESNMIETESGRNETQVPKDTIATEEQETRPENTEPTATEPPAYQGTITELPAVSDSDKNSNTTQPPATNPPTTEPTATNPSETDPPETEPLATDSGTILPDDEF